MHAMSGANRGLERKCAAYPEEIKRMVEFVEIPYPEKWGEEIRKSFSEERVLSSAKKRSEDKEIEALLVEPGLI